MPFAGSPNLLEFNLKITSNHTFELIHPNASCICPHECELFESTVLIMIYYLFNGQNTHLHSCVRRPCYIAYI